jgi:hypothetical protein
MTRALLTFLFFLIGATACTAQQKTTERPKVAVLLAALHAEKWSDRASACEQLLSSPDAMNNPEVKSALIDLVDRENRTDLSKEAGFDPEASEGYAEYIGELLGTVATTADWKDPRQVCILAHSPYDPDSPFAAQLAMTGQLVIPCLMRMTESSSWGDRYQAVALLIQICARADNVTSETVQRIRQVTIAALHDREDTVRVGTVNALKNFGGEDMIPPLRQVAQSDPGPEVSGQSIRKSAVAAIDAIQERTKKSPQLQ